MRVSLLAASATAVLVSAPASALVIRPIYDSSITSLSNSAQIQSAFNTIANDYAKSFVSPVTVNVGVSWGKVAGSPLPSTAVGASSNNLYGYFNYSQVKSYLTRASQSNPSDTSLATALRSMPASLTSGPTNFAITSANAKALGIVSGTQSSPDAYIGFAGSPSGYAFTPSQTTASVYDFQAVAAHELAEVLGRISGVDNGSWRSPLDLFRYSAPGVLSYNYNQASYFSIDGGRTRLATFNNSSTGGDRGDWLTTSATHDVSDAFISKGQRKNLTAVDLTALDVLGWGGSNLGNSGASAQTPAFYLISGPAVPEPATWAMMLGGFGLLGMAVRRRKRANVTFA
ncbi:hypothetical protein SCH01S_29_00920 [Sphingomonas changbaiensis NBRC 104936]|uniref:Ice-binding protein C-terminal domain-containing protein n=1 Tax=Sphingomonas changbaiensis NBRC 104936 TaxID=1219043 RepID=A0A0E9MPD9_9SPHN|nr:NF038122 family metalloprotease [Sphingomonas changbaiensis]GAO39404.1 hypothetical protein SCH01S_29_00920 [Sphingomonas changbaiensis NBRC 104936]